MNFQIDFGIWGGIFAVPTAIADRYLKLCSESQLKVLLLALRDAPNPIDPQYIAKRLALTPTQVCDGLEYWQAAGVFTQNEGSVSEPAVPAAVPAAATAPSTAVTEATEGAAGQRITMVHSRSKLTPSQFSELCRTDPNLPWLLGELQQRLARTLSPAESETVAYLYSYLRLTPDYLLMAVEYCKNQGKTNLRYIEKLVTGWVDAGIDDHEKAEQHIKELAKRTSNEGLIRNLFGIGERDFTTKEKEFIHLWLDEYQLDLPLIQLACERTVDNTGKIAFPYLHKILSQWHSKGIRTAQQAAEEMSSRQTQGQARRFGEDPSFDLGDIAEVMKRNAQDGSR
ncbi:MAG: DnaD domain protein [Angelakisella sp.]